MTDQTNANDQSESFITPLRVRLPGFIRVEEVGAGDAVKRVTYALGIKPCGGCERRAASLNRRMVFTR
jgi:hypothetical protein